MIRQIHLSTRRVIPRGPHPAHKPRSLSSNPSPSHHDLHSFLLYAHRASLSPSSPTYIGTHYEYVCLLALRRLSFTLTRTGGRSDAGIDLLGHWHLPSLPYPLRALVQCKALRSKPSPNLIRELEGIYAGAPPGWRNGRRDGSRDGGGTVVVLCAKREATRGVREAVRRSGAPVVWVMVEELEEGVGRVRQVLWNARVSEMGAEGMSVGVKYLPQRELGGKVEREMALTWKGEVWEPDTGKKDGEGEEHRGDKGSGFERTS